MKPFMLPLAAALLFGATPAALAGSCAETVTQTQAALDKLLNALAAAGPTAPESAGALLSHEPTPESIAQSEAALGDGTRPEAVQQTLDLARQADANGDEAACKAQVAKARALLNLK